MMHPARRPLECVPILILLLAVVPIHAFAGGSESGGPVSRWDFNGSLDDRSGRIPDILTARDPKGNTVPPRFAEASEVPGAEGSALALNVQPGDPAYLTAPPSDDVRLGPTYSIEAWIYPIRLGTWNRLVLQWGGAPRYAYHVAIHKGRLSLYHGQRDGRFGVCEGGDVHAGEWQHIAAVAQWNEENPTQSILRVYLNGRRVATATFDGTILTLDREALGIGDSAGIPSATCRFQGYIDDLIIWNRALSDEDVSAHAAKRGEVLRRIAATRRKAELARRAALSARLKSLGVEEIVFAERAPGRDPSGHYYANFGYSCCNPEEWLHGADGGRLCKLNVATGEVAALLDDPKGAVRDPHVHYEAEKILFSYRKGGSHRYHLHEIGADGTGLRQLTSGPWDDIEPAVLPGGDLVFCSTRCKRFIGCWIAEAATLHRCTGDGKEIRLLSSGSFTENTPAVLPDGRVLYTRWEYVNRDPVTFHHLWALNPDGSGQMVYFGNMHPGGVFIDAKPIPGSDRVVLIHSPGHGRNEHAGNVAIISNSSGPDAIGTMKHITRSGDFRDPYPLSEDALLVVKGKQILLMNSKGKAEILHTARESMVHEPQPLIRRPREPAIPPRGDPEKTKATLLLSNVYLGRNTSGMKPGAIKRLLVLEDLPKPANFHGGGSQPIGHGVTSTLKRILGTVPVEPDGSAHFEVPALRSLYFAALDESGLSVKQMRSFVTLQPGETAGCMGCHEPRSQAPPSGSRPAFQALSRPPSSIERIEDIPSILDFPRDVQPILDRRCLQCHDHEKREGGVVLAGDRGPVFSHSYYSLFLHWQVKDTAGDPGHGSGRQPGNDRPYTTYSSASPLMKKIDGSHHDVELTRREKKVIRLWIDSGAQYAGTYAAYGTGQVGGCWRNNEPVRVMADSWASTQPARDAIQRRCGSCHKNQIPRHVTDQNPLDPWGDLLSWVRPLSRYSRHRLYNLSRPERSLILLAPLSREGGGYAEGDPSTGQQSSNPFEEDRGRPPQAVIHPVVFANPNDPDYRAILSHIEDAKRKLDEIKRFDMAGFRPNEHYIREMQRFGILPRDLPANTTIDVYATDEAYWRSFWYNSKRP